MPNRFFTNLIDLIAGTRARAGDVEANFTLVEQGFDDVAAEIDSLEDRKASRSGATYTGAHNFSGASTVTLPFNTMIGSAEGAEIAALDGLTGNIQTQLDGKVFRAGDTYTGNHSFVGAVLRAATQVFGTSGTLVATVEYVNQAMFQTVLPSQLGQEPGSVLTTNAGVATWEKPVSPNGRIYFSGSF